MNRLNSINNKIDHLKVIEGDSRLSEPAAKLKIGIVASRFNDYIVDRLIKGAIETLCQQGTHSSNIELISVPGAMEIPLAVQNVAKRSDIAGVIALGVVIKGDTAHFDYVAGESIAGVNKVSLQYNKPTACGILTTNTIEQAIERAGCKAGNKGSEAALVLINMISLLEKLGEEY